MAWRDVTADEPGAHWRGLVFAHPSPAPARGWLQAQAAGARRGERHGHARLMRLQAGKEAVLWARVEDDHSAYEYLVSSTAWTHGMDVIPPLRFAATHEVGHPDPADQDRYWARHFVESLVAHAHGPLERDEYVMLSCSLSNKLWEEMAQQRQQGVGDWDFSRELAPFAMRDPRSVEAGRVHAWRKLARAGTLPPVLLWWVSGLDRYVVLDGIHRALAALEEGVHPRCLSLTRYGERKSPPTPDARNALTRGLEQALWPQPAAGAAPTSAPNLRPALSVHTANRLLIEAYDARPGALWTTRAWPIPGGRERWLGEVRSELSRCEARDCTLLDGL